MISGTLTMNSDGFGNDLGNGVRKMEDKSKLCPHCEDEFLTREKMILHAISCDYKTWTHEQWPLICPKCSDRRMLWPTNQSINSLSDPKAQFIHSNGLKDC